METCKRRKIILRLLFLVSFLAISYIKGMPAEAKTYNLDLTLNGSWTSDGKISDDSDVYFYTFTLPKAGTVTIDYQARSLEHSTWSINNADMSKEYYAKWIYDASETSPVTNTKTLVLEKGSYVVKVSRRNERSGSFRLKGSFVATNNNEKEPNNTFESAMPIQTNKVITGLISEDDDYDFYTFNLYSGKEITVTFKHMFNDVGVSIWDKNYKEIVGKGYKDGSEESPGNIEITEYLKGGTYYIKVGKVNGYTGRYNLSFRSEIPVSSVRIQGRHSLVIGKNIQLSAVVSPTDATNRKVEWSSDNTYVAKVSQSGKVTALRAGTATIKAKSKADEDIVAEFEIAVTPKRIKKLTAKRMVNRVGKKTIAVKWKSKDGASGYHVQFSANKNFKKAKNIYVSSDRPYCYITAHKRLGFYYYNVYKMKLKKKKAYYLRVRPYVSSDAGRYYAAWSGRKQIRLR